MGDATQTCDDTAVRSGAKLVRLARPAMPLTLGLALSNACFNITFNEDALHQEGLLAGNGHMFAVIAIMALAMFALARHNGSLRPSTARLAAVCGIVLQVAAAAGLGLLAFAQTDMEAVRFAYVVVMDVASLATLGYFLRCARGVSASMAAVIVFGAVIISEPFICIAAFLPYGTTYVLVASLALLQALCLHLEQKHPLQPNVLNSGEAESTSYFNLAKNMPDDKRLLVMTAVGIWILALAKAVIRVFPAGHPIPYTPATLAVYFALTIVVAAVILYVALDERSSIMVVGIWLIMQNLAVCALLACGFFPDRLDIGLSFTYVLDVLLLAYAWYVALAFMSYGRQDPFYYVAGGLIAFLLPRSLTSVIMPLVMGSINQAAATTSVAAALLLLCAQFLFLRLPRVPVVAQRLEARERPLSHVAERAFGIERPADTSTAMRMAIMQSHAGRMKEQFMLSDREAEVLALYALGHTQEKIASELFLSPGTVHTYVKRIYSKTDLHSRQAILDFIERYAG